MAKSITSKPNPSDTNKQKTTANKTGDNKPNDAKQNKTIATKSTPVASTKPKTKSQKIGSTSTNKADTKVSAKSSEVKSSSKSKASKESTKAVSSKDNSPAVATQPPIKKKKFPASVVFGKPPAKKVEEKTKSAPAKAKNTKETQPKATVAKVTAKVAPSKVATVKVVSKVEVSKTANAKKAEVIAKQKTAQSTIKLQPKVATKTTVQVKPEPVKVQASHTKTKAEPPKPVTTAKKVTKNSKIAASKTSAVNKPANKANIRYSDEDLAIFKQIIEQQKGEIIEEINSLNERIEAFNNRDFTEESTYSLHMAEQTSDAIEAERARNRISDLTDLVKKLNDAMIRIENKTYGICRICNCLIAKERLLVVPVTTLSASYKLHGKCPEDGIDRTEKIK